METKAQNHEVRWQEFHQLMRLIEKAGITVTDQQANFLRELSAYYTLTRYPNEKGDQLKEFNKSDSFNLLIRTEEFFNWLQTMI